MDRTALYDAAEADQIEVVKVLLDEKAEVDMQSKVPFDGIHTNYHI
jgi:hypothetical protein